MRGSSFPIGRVFGIQVRVHATWLLAFVFITWALATGYFRLVAPRQGLATPFVLGVVSALLLFASVLVHEFSHSLVARARGLHVRNITLFIFGGVSNISGEARTARDEFLIAVVGPLTSFALAGIFWLLATAVGSTAGLGLLLGSARGFRTLSAPGAVLTYLAVVNLVLGAFNLLPAFPLDGGRVFRSIIWGLTRRYGRATTIATLVGEAFGYGMVGLGVVRVLAFGDLVGGLWTMLIGWFLSQAARVTRREHTLRRTLGGILVEQVMDSAPALVDDGSSLQQVVFDHLLSSGRRRVIVVRDGRAIGQVEASSVGRVPRDRWPITPLADVMQPVGPTVAPDARLADVLDKLQGETALLPVVADDRLVGALDLAHVQRYAQLREDLQVPMNTAQPAPA